MIRSEHQHKLMGLLALVAASLAGAPSLASAAEFYAMIANLNDVRRPHAQIDVAIDTRTLAGGPVAILFDVFGVDGSSIAEFHVVTNQDGFASSSSAAPPNDNLFTLSGGLPALVRVKTPILATTATVLLRQTRLTLQGVAKPDIVLGVRPIMGLDGTTVAMGPQFAVTIGDIASRATLLIGNVSGPDVVADVFRGTTGVPGSGKYTNLRLQNRELWVVNLDPTDANSNMAITGTGDLVVQLAVEGGEVGRLAGVTVLPAHR